MLICIIDPVGGGYTKKNVARCWAYETAVLVGSDATLSDDIPPNAYYGYYEPTYKLNRHVTKEQVQIIHLPRHHKDNGQRWISWSGKPLASQLCGAMCGDYTFDMRCFSHQFCPDALICGKLAYLVLAPPTAGEWQRPGGCGADEGAAAGAAQPAAPHPRSAPCTFFNKYI